MTFDSCPALNRFTRLVAALLVCATGLAPAVHAEGRDDRLCAPAAAGHADPVLDAGGNPEAQHCDVCHWLRSLRALDAADAALAADRVVVAVPPAADLRAGDPPHASPRTSRAPPRA